MGEIRQKKREIQRATLNRWFRWVPVLAIVFSPLFMDAWLNTRVRQHDYTESRLIGERSQLKTQLQALHIEEAGVQDLDRLAQRAPNLGLIPPSPGQLVSIKMDEDGNPSRQEMTQPFSGDAFAVASRGNTVEEEARNLATTSDIMLDMTAKVLSHTFDTWNLDELFPRDTQLKTSENPASSTKEASQSALVSEQAPNTSRPVSLDDSLEHLLDAS